MKSSSRATAAVQQPCSDRLTLPVLSYNLKERLDPKTSLRGRHRGFWFNSGYHVQPVTQAVARPMKEFGLFLAIGKTDANEINAKSFRKVPTIIPTALAKTLEYPFNNGVPFQCLECLLASLFYKLRECFTHSSLLRDIYFLHRCRLACDMLNT